MTESFRVLDTGVLEGRLNIAIGQAIVEAHQRGDVPDTLRYLRFPPTVLIGRHQALAHWHHEVEKCQWKRHCCDQGIAQYHPQTGNEHRY